MKARVYLDTSVFGAVCDPGPTERLLVTRRVLDGLARERWEGFISTLVLEEVDRAPEAVRGRIMGELRRSGVTVIEESAESLELARLYMASGAMPTNGEYDARHISVATVNGIHTVVSWNFCHMVNVERRRQINAINLRENLALLDIVSPWEIGDEEL
ncbi:MAG: hypothetical protein HYR50_05065 [Candidatus Rokubacteria bacterium]|nr:hypothetical protein [Candidatus Rokubacteria bacterium]